MIIKYIRLHNWRNFRDAEIELSDKIFIVGPNACGKSNFLDAFRFMHDIVKDGGGLKKALENRGGLSKIRFLSSRDKPNVELEFSFAKDEKSKINWKYTLSLMQEQRGTHRTLVAKESVWNSEKGMILERPNKEDSEHSYLLEETSLEQSREHIEFRELYDFFNKVSYLHIIPQILRNPKYFGKMNIPMEEDSYGFHLLEKIQDTSKSVRESRLRKIGEALNIAVPQLSDLELIEPKGIPHLQANYSHWRKYGAKQNESEFSDGTLRLIGLLWVLLETNSMVLLEEPELSLNSEIIAQIPNLIYEISKMKTNKTQTLITTHSYDLLSDLSISGNQVLRFIPQDEGTTIERLTDDDESRTLLESGMDVGEVALPKTSPANINDISRVINDE